jgi:hypothetical protein
LGTTLAAVGGWRYARASAPVPGPIILISVDTLRADHLPAYGYRNVTTPAIDSLARDGIVFERAYGHAVQTLPAHVALLSGRLPFDTGVRDDRAAEGERAALADAARSGIRNGGIVHRAAAPRDGHRSGLTSSTMRCAAAAAAATELTVGEPRDGANRNRRRTLAVAFGRSTRLSVSHCTSLMRRMPPERFASLAPDDGAIATRTKSSPLHPLLKTNQLDQSTTCSSDHGEGLRPRRAGARLFVMTKRSTPLSSSRRAPTQGGGSPVSTRPTSSHGSTS